MKKKKPLLSNRVEQSRQLQMIRLLKCYSTLVMTPNTWILPYNYTIEYLDLGRPRSEPITNSDFFCNTNNIVFAAMIFEAQALPVKICITKIIFNYVHL